MIFTSVLYSKRINNKFYHILWKYYQKINHVRLTELKRLPPYYYYQLLFVSFLISCCRFTFLNRIIFCRFLSTSRPTRKLHRVLYLNVATRWLSTVKLALCLESREIFICVCGDGGVGDIVLDIYIYIYEIGVNDNF